MKKESKEMLKTIISNQELIMKALNIAAPVKKIEKELQKTTTISAPAKTTSKVKAPVKKAAVTKKK